MCIVNVLWGKVSLLNHLPASLYLYNIHLIMGNLVFLFCIHKFQDKSNIRVIGNSPYHIVLKNLSGELILLLFLSFSSLQKLVGRQFSLTYTEKCVLLFPVRTSRICFTNAILYHFQSNKSRIGTIFLSLSSNKSTYATRI